MSPGALNRFSINTSSSKDWYQNTTVVGHNFLNNRLADTQLRRLRFWSYTRNFIGPSSLALRLHCQQTYSPVHYLLNCPLEVPKKTKRWSPPWRLQTSRSSSCSIDRNKINIPIRHHPTSTERPPINTTINNKHWTEDNTNWPKFQQGQGRSTVSGSRIVQILRWQILRLNIERRSNLVY